MTSHFLSCDNWSNTKILDCLELGLDIKNNPEKFQNYSKNKILGNLFFEPSTRTYFSFQSAMQQLGGTVLGFPNPDNTSKAKGESFSDTLMVMSQYCHIMALRHSQTDLPSEFFQRFTIPIINSGDGAGEHPTQTLTDLLTIYSYFKNFKLTVGIWGDCRFGRTTHSLLTTLARFGCNFYCIAPDELQMPEKYLDLAKQSGSNIKLTENINTALPHLDILYLSRLQKERYPKDLDIINFEKDFILQKNYLEKFSKNGLILHPLPRVTEIPQIIDSDPRAKYFEQAGNGVWTRMALLVKLLGQN